MSPSGTSQDTVAESAFRCMTDTLTGAGGRSGGREHEEEMNPEAFKPLKGLVLDQQHRSRKSRIICVQALDGLFVLTLRPPKVTVVSLVTFLTFLAVQQLVICE